ncbi:hypothetical protein MMC11_008595 [Xylographa trunciseda]|nr:hypothetical protein [Xylographa trunciseda]
MIDDSRALETLDVNRFLSMAWFGDCFGGLLFTWPLLHCLSQHEPEEDWPPLKPVDVKPSFFQQPPLIPPPKIDFGISHPITRNYSHSSRWNSDNRTLLSRASSIASHATRKSRSRRPTIGAPSHFRRVETPLGRPEKGFRPLELSIYIPGNELPPLPVFNRDGLIDLSSLEAPPQAHLRKTRSETVLSRSSTAFSISQNALGPNRCYSRADSIYSYDDSASLSPSMLSRSHSIYVDAVTALPQSTLSFLDLLDEGPRPPVPLKIKTRNRSRSPDPVRRNASDQNMRLRAHIEERQEMESRLQDFDTIVEEWRISADVPTSRDIWPPRAESTILATMERTLTQRNPQFAKSAPHLPYTRRPLPQIPAPPLPRQVTLPISHFNPSYAQPLRPRFSPPSAPPTCPPPALPQAQLFQGPHWSHFTSPPTSPTAAAFQHERQVSASTVSSESCPSLASAWSTPRSSPQRTSKAMYEIRSAIPSGEVVGWKGDSPVGIDKSVTTMDPLTAFGLAAAVLQFIQFGMQVAARLEDYRSSNPNEIPKSIEAICTQLPLLLNAFNRMSSEASLNKLDFDTRCILKGVVAGCMTQVEEIEKIVRQISNEPGQSLGVKMRKVFVSLKSEEKIWAIERNLHTYISVLILHHVVDSSEAPERIPDDTSYFDVREERVSPFYERDGLVQALGDRLRAASRSQIDVPTVVVLEGPEGVGKTQLALEYCYQANKLDQFRTVFWLDASTEESLCLGLESMSATIRRTKQGSRTEKIDFIKKFLGELWHPWLLVLDNYQHFAWGDLLEYLPKTGYGGIIFITRDSTSSNLGSAISVRKYLTTQEQSRLDSSIANAVQSDDLEMVKALISEGADVNALVYNQWPCLHRAALLGSPKMVSFLLANGADPGDRALQDRPLWWAAYGGYPDVVKILLDHDDMTSYVPTLQENNLAYLAAAEKGSLESIRLLLNRREITYDAKDRRGQTALELAAKNGHVDVVKLLLERSAYSKDKNSHEQALMGAMSHFNQHHELAKVFCTTGKVNPNAQSQDGGTPLYYAASSKDDSSREENGANITRFFLELGADPNLLNKEGRGPLHEAALYNHTNTLKLLLEHGANPTTEDRLGYTPLLSAIKYKSQDTASILLDIDISDPAKRKSYLESTFKFAARNGDRDTILSILEKGSDIDINCVDWKGKTPLLLAVDGEHQSTARLLAKHGARQDIADADGRLPLHVAAACGFDSVVKDLVRAGKNCDMKNSKGETALCLAAAKGHEKTVELLLKLGADRELANRFGDTPLDLAEENHHEKIVKLLEEMQVK